MLVPSLKPGVAITKSNRVISKSSNRMPATIEKKPVRCYCRAAVRFFADFDNHEKWVRAKLID
jgi:hypothetical protein